MNSIESQSNRKIEGCPISVFIQVKNTRILPWISFFHTRWQNFSYPGRQIL